MSGGARGPSRPTAPKAGAMQIPPPPPKRNLSTLASMKPPFLPPDDYHRFSSASDFRQAADREAEALVVRSPVSLLLFSLFYLILSLGEQFTWPKV
jgi:transcription factor E2F3